MKKYWNRIVFNSKNKLFFKKYCIWLTIITIHILHTIRKTLFSVNIKKKKNKLLLSFFFFCALDTNKFRLNNVFPTYTRPQIIRKSCIYRMNTPYSKRFHYLQLFFLHTQIKRPMKNVFHFTYAENEITSPPT